MPATLCSRRMGHENKFIILCLGFWYTNFSCAYQESDSGQADSPQTGGLALRRPEAAQEGGDGDVTRSRTRSHARRHSPPRLFVLGTTGVPGGIARNRLASGGTRATGCAA